MQLLTAELRKNIPPLYTFEDSEPQDVPVACKFFDPCGSWTWYVTEFDGDDLFFGLVDGDWPELGYFSLSELQSVKGPLGIGIERDIHFQGCTLQDAQDAARRRRAY